MTQKITDACLVKKGSGLFLNQMTPAPYAQIDLTPPASAIIKSHSWI
jgi:hypothetical protein